MESREVQLLAQSPLLGPKLQVRNHPQASGWDITLFLCPCISRVDLNYSTLTYDTWISSGAFSSIFRASECQHLLLVRRGCSFAQLGWILSMLNFEVI